MGLDEFKFSPRGKVKISYAWANKEMSFSTGAKQYRRWRIHAKKSYSFTLSGTAKTLDSLVGFYNKHKGCLNPFYFTYDGVRELCRFSDTISPKLLRENGKVVGFTCEIGLIVDKQEKKYPAPAETDLLPLPHKEITHSRDWGIKKIEMGAVQYRFEYKNAKEILSVSFSGTKKDRDNVITLFNSHCKTPVTLKVGDKTCLVQFPDSIEITDLREVKKIIGYECKMDLEVVKWI